MVTARVPLDDAAEARMAGSAFWGGRGWTCTVLRPRTLEILTQPHLYACSPINSSRASLEGGAALLPSGYHVHVRDEGLAQKGHLARGRCEHGVSGLGAPASGARGLRCAHRGPRQGLADRDYITAAACNGSGNRDERGNSESSPLNAPLKTELMTLLDFLASQGRTRDGAAHLLQTLGLQAQAPREQGARSTGGQFPTARDAQSVLPLIQMLVLLLLK